MSSRLFSTLKKPLKAYHASTATIVEAVEDIDHGFDALCAADQARIRAVVDAAARARAPSAADIRQSSLSGAGGAPFWQPQQALYGTPRESEPPSPKRRRVEQSAPATTGFKPGCGGTCGEALDTLLEPLTDGGGLLGLACCVSVDGLVTKQAVNEDKLTALINEAHKEWRFLGDRCRERVEFLKAVGRELKRKGKNRYFYSQKCRSHVGVVSSALAQIKKNRKSGSALAQNESPAASTGPPVAAVPHEFAALGAAMTGAVARAAAFEVRPGSAASDARPVASYAFVERLRNSDKAESFQRILDSSDSAAVRRRVARLLRDDLDILEDFHHSTRNKPPPVARHGRTIAWVHPATGLELAAYVTCDEAGHAWGVPESWVADCVAGRASHANGLQFESRGWWPPPGGARVVSAARVRQGVYLLDGRFRAQLGSTWGFLGNFASEAAAILVRDRALRRHALGAAPRRAPVDKGPGRGKIPCPSCGSYVGTRTCTCPDWLRI